MESIKKVKKDLPIDEEEIVINQQEIKEFTGSEFCELTDLNSRDLFFVEKRFANETHTFKEWVELLKLQKLDVKISNNLKNIFNLS